MTDVLLLGNRAAELRMESRVTVRRTTGRMVQDETSGREVPEWVVVYAAIPFRLRGGDRGAQTGMKTVEVAGVELQLATAEGHMPAWTTNLRDNDLIEIVSGENAGTVWRILESGRGDQQTARRVPIIEARRPSEWV